MISSAFTKKANANSDAMAIAGLSAVGIDTEKTLKTKSGVTPIRRLIKYQKSNGQLDGLSVVIADHFKWPLSKRPTRWNNIVI